MKNKVDVIYCEPFILPGILPTLGAATLKSMARDNGVICKILYPSMVFFSKNQLYNNSEILELVENTPIQLVEFLFIKEKHVDNALDYICNNLTENQDVIRTKLIAMRNLAIAALDELVDEICEINPRILSCSTTFGDLNFSLLLWEKVKKRLKDIIIICGGSNCSPEFSKTLFKASADLDYVICDEVGTVTTSLINSLLCGFDDCHLKKYVSTENHIAEQTNKLDNLDSLPCPDFDDFMETAKKMSIDTTMLTLPYEYSRGCWWGEKHPCSMCGFFGTQQKFLCKSSEKAIEELRFLSQKYNVKRFRFTDLVNPRKEDMHSLLPLEESGLTLFWELRPDLDKEHIELLRRVGLASGQIGIESFSTDELCRINKGTTGIWNIYILRLLSEYKIEVFWNYLFGFVEDKKEWYEDAINVLPKLHHLQPPSLRKIWINRYSQLFEQSNFEKLIPIGDNVFHKEIDSDSNFFFKTKLKSNMKNTYQLLSEHIQKWKKAFSSHCYLLVDYEDELIIIRRGYLKEEKICFDKLTSCLYEFLRCPRTENEICEAFEGFDNIQKILNVLIKNNLVIFMDNKYLALACFPTKYRWDKYYNQTSYAGSRIFMKDEVKKERG